MPHGHPDNFPDRGEHPNRRAFGRPTPRLNALINNTIETPYDNPGPAVVSMHRKSRAGLFKLMDSLPIALEMPKETQSEYFDTVSGLRDMHDTTSGIINMSVANRGAIRRDLKNMENEKFEWPDE